MTGFAASATCSGSTDEPHVRAMTSRGHEYEKREEAKRSQPRPSLDHLVKVVRREAGDEIAEMYRKLNTPPNNSGQGPTTSQE
jgi:hypothetical protein